MSRPRTTSRETRRGEGKGEQRGSILVRSVTSSQRWRRRFSDTTGKRSGTVIVNNTDYY